MIKQILFDDKVEVAISEIDDGNMRFFDDVDETIVIKNQKKLCNTIGLGNAVRIRTIYGNRKSFIEFAEIAKENLSNYSISHFEKEILVSDGLATRETEVGILLPLADCLGAVVFDEKQKIVGLLHAGRQNIEQNGPKKFIEYFVDNFGSNVTDIKVYFSPYALNYHIFELDRKLGEVAKEQFMDAGVLPDNILDPKVDTVDNDNFPSYSSGDTNKRFAIIVKQDRLV